MSTVTASAEQTAGSATTSRVPLVRLLRVELRKTIDTRAGMWLLIAIAVVTAAVVVIFFFAGSPDNLTLNNFLDATGTPQSFLLPVLGILAITSEWSQRTGLVTFTLEPSRMRVVTAKFIAMVLLGLAAVVVAFALAAAGNWLGSVLRSGNGSWHYPASWVLEVTIGQVIGVVQGLAFGMLFMSSAAAIVIYYVVPIAWSILFGVISSLNSAGNWLDLNTASAPLFSHEMTASSWAHLAVATTLWVVLPLVVGLIRLLRSEVK